jgi:hypothetical protein
MNIISKLLLGVGSKELDDIQITPFKIFKIAIVLGLTFFGAIGLLIFFASKLI